MIFVRLIKDSLIFHNLSTFHDSNNNFHFLDFTVCENPVKTLLKRTPVENSYNDNNTCIVYIIFFDYKAHLRFLLVLVVKVAPPVDGGGEADPG